MVVIEPLKFPVLRFGRGMVFPAIDQAQLTECTKTALQKGFFSGLILVDSDGKAWKIKTARKLHGIGPFLGFNVFLNQKIRVELIPEGEPFEMSAAELKARVLECFRGAQEWSARADLDRLVISLEQAQSPADIARIVSRAYFETKG